VATGHLSRSNSFPDAAGKGGGGGHSAPLAELIGTLFACMTPLAEELLKNCTFAENRACLVEI
jgi:hypothetical protein